MANRVYPHHSVSRNTTRKLHHLKVISRPQVPMGRFVDEAVNLYELIVTAGRPLVCTPAGTSIVVSELDGKPYQEANHD